MCIACRQMQPKGSLIKVVKSPLGTVAIDDTYKLPGRGAYICKESQCIEKAIKKRLLNKSFSANIVQEVYSELEQQLK